MVSSNRQAIACILLIFSTAFYSHALCTKSLTRLEESLSGPLRTSAISALKADLIAEGCRGTQRTAEKNLKSPRPPRLFVQSHSQAQTTPAKNPTASISGKVTLKGKGVPGIVVVALNSEHRGDWARANHRTKTDASGNYRISSIPEGTYRVTPHALAFVLEDERASNTLMVSDGETIENMNFALVRGGVITGKVTDAEDQPLIEQSVSLVPINDQGGNMTYIRHGRRFQTDDRGVYRAFGLRPGKYRVFAGEPRDDRVPGRAAEAYRTTFYPGTTDEAKATVIEVSEGSEISGIDIVLSGRTPKGFQVTGQIVDGETGKPLPDIYYGVTQKYEGGSSSTSGSKSNAAGEFKLENLLPGNYSVFIVPMPNTNARANPVPFEITDRDITGLTIKTVKGASLSGVVLLDGIEEKPLRTKLGELTIHAWVETSEPNDEYHNPSSPFLKPDGTFYVPGLRAGTARIALSSMNRSNGSDYGIVRIERDGVVQPNNAVNLKDGEQVSGLRIIVKQLSGAIRGQVKIEGGELPPTARMSVGIALLDNNRSSANRSYRGEEVDSRGRFHIDALTAGSYEVRVMVVLPGPNPRFIESKQEVTVADNAVSEVVVTLTLKADP